MALRFAQLGDVLDEPGVAEALRAFDCGDEPWARRLNDDLRN